MTMRITNGGAGSTSPASAGSAFEVRVIGDLRRRGWVVYWACNPRHPYDLIAVDRSTGAMVPVECKSNRATLHRAHPDAVVAFPSPQTHDFGRIIYVHRGPHGRERVDMRPNTVLSETETKQPEA